MDIKIYKEKKRSVGFDLVLPIIFIILILAAGVFVFLNEHKFNLAMGLGIVIILILGYRVYKETKNWNKKELLNTVVQNIHSYEVLSN